ncbi:C-x8-C-x5-C-x3-H type zinc finger protein [Colletotrichum truncatum]|uniref:C-x8-C-x5-C-x3-H type zinc finger protein n=1 Tax=Colletotrichum truncatum TaxID=5467 RepID=A0ACC3YCI9_COLTU
MDNGVDLFAYTQKLEICRDSDRTRDLIIQDLMRRFDLLQHLYNEKCGDLENEVESRRMWQTKADNVAKELTHQVKANESSPFIFAIIDGDGAIFQEALLRRGAEGGAEAGHFLCTELKKQVASANPNVATEDWNVILQVVLNIDGLAKRLHASDIIPNTANERTLAEFGRGLGRAQPLFSFIDVGSGKESADHKIRETLRVMVRVNQCRHIFFGPCHDNGYLPVLEPYKLDHTVAGKLTLVETTPAEEGFKRLGFPMISLKSIFMPEKLSERVTRPAAGDMIPPAGPTAALARPLVIMTKTEPVNNCGSAKAVTANPSNSPKQPLNGSETSTSWSAVTNSSSTIVIDISPAKRAPVLKYYLLNKDGQRVDEELSEINPAAESSFNGKVKKHETNFCNYYHLRNNCKNLACQYIHGDKLSQGELLSRGIPCSMGSNCVDIDCTSGHHCRWLRDCHHKYCRFEGYHDIDSTPRVKVFSDQSRKVINKL